MNARPQWTERPRGRSRRSLTVVLIPGEGRALYQWRFSAWVLAVLAAAALALLAGAGYVLIRDHRQRADLAQAAALSRADLQVALDLERGRQELLRVALLEGRLRGMLRYHSRKSLFKARKLPGPDEADVLRLAEDLEHDPADADGDVRPGVEALVAAARARERSVEQVLAYVHDKRTRLDSRPSGWPVHGWISSGFGKRVDPVSGRKGFHTGVDIANDTGTPVRCTADGRVAFAAWDGGYGKLVIVDHGNGFSTYYGHLSQIRVAPGERVHKGALVGLMGATGNTTGPHVHYEIRLYGVPVNPIKYMRTRK